MVAIPDIPIPSEFLDLAEQWHSGQDDLLYAVASVGSLRRGSQRPYNDDEGRPMTDEEWTLDLWRGLSVDVAYARRIAERNGDDDAAELQRFEDFCDYVVARIGIFKALEESKVQR